MKFNNFLDWLSAVILFLAILLVIGLAYSHLKKENIYKIEIKYELNRKDSLKIFSSNIDIKKFDSTLSKLRDLSEEIQQKQYKLIEKQENNDYFNKFYSIVVAVILVIASFFGYKNVAEIKQRAIKDAKKTAIKSSKTEFTAIFTKVYKAKVFEEATKATNNIINGEIESLKEDIKNITERLDKLEQQNGNLDNVNVSESRNNSEDELVEPKNPFDQNEE